MPHIATIDVSRPITTTLRPCVGPVRHVHGVPARVYLRTPVPICNHRVTSSLSAWQRGADQASDRAEREELSQVMVAPVIPTDPAAAPPGTGMNYARLYDYRFRDVDQAGRQAVWREIARYVHAKDGRAEARSRPGGRAAASSSPRSPPSSAGASTWSGRPTSRPAASRMITADIRDADLPDGLLRRRVPVELPRAPAQPGHGGSRCSASCAPRCRPAAGSR